MEAFVARKVITFSEMEDGGPGFADAIRVLMTKEAHDDMKRSKGFDVVPVRSVTIIDTDFENCVCTISHRVEA